MGHDETVQAAGRVPAEASERSTLHARQQSAMRASTLPVLEPAEVHAGLLGRLAGRSVLLAGECQGAFISGGGLRFELCDGRFRSVPVVVENAAPRARSDPRRYLRSQGCSEAALLRSGNLLMVRGSLRVTSGAGVELVASHVSTVTGSPGPIEAERRRAAQNIRDECAGDRRVLDRLDAPQPHLREFGLAEVLTEPITSLWVISARSSQTRSDLLRALGRRFGSTVVHERRVPVRGPDASTRIAAAIRAVEPLPGRVVVVHRGGGGWRDFVPFDSLEVARAILESPLPVLTAIGHADDVTLADRVATGSGATPSALGFEINRYASALAKRPAVSGSEAGASTARSARAGSARSITADARVRAAETSVAELRAAHDRLVLEHRRELARSGKAHRQQLTRSEAEHRRVVVRSAEEHRHASARIAAEHRATLIDAAIRRIRVRSIVLAAALLALGIGALVLAVRRGVDGDALGAVLAGLIVPASVLGARFVVAGPERAARPPTPRQVRRDLPPPDSPPWTALARRVSTPRAHRIVFGRDAGHAPGMTRP